MGKRISSTAIGLFVVGGLALILAAVVVLGSGRLFGQHHRFICFFQGSLNGLRVGAPVKSRGVQIGSVVSVLLELPPEYGRMKDESSTDIPVIIDLDETQIRRHGGAAPVSGADVQRLIDQGLRAQLNMESLLTGLLFVDLEFYPATKPHLLLEAGSSKYFEIPTVPTDLAQIQQAATRTLAKLENTDFQALVIAITDTANSANAFLNSADLRNTIRSIQQTADNLNGTVTVAREELVGLNAKADPLIARMNKTADDADAALTQAKLTMANFQMMFTPDSPIAYRLDVALDNFSRASDAVHELANYLQRNPSSIVRGRYVSDGKHDSGK